MVGSGCWKGAWCACDNDGVWTVIGNPDDMVGKTALWQHLVMGKGCAMLAVMNRLGW